MKYVIIQFYQDYYGYHQVYFNLNSVLVDSSRESVSERIWTILHATSYTFKALKSDLLHQQSPTQLLSFILSLRFKRRIQVGKTHSLRLMYSF